MVNIMKENTDDVTNLKQVLESGYVKNLILIKHFSMITCECKALFNRYLLIFILLTVMNDLNAQSKVVLTSLPTLPDKEGWAGMYGGVSNGVLFCMGGANFPDKRPWEGGKKKWYDNIFMLQDGKAWVKLEEKLPSPLAYGVSISFNEYIILIGGYNESFYSDKVIAYKWNGRSLQIFNYPDLPVPLANMAGTIVKNLAIIAGGSSSSAGKAINKCYALDLENIQTGWFELPSWPGRERVMPVCAAYNDKFYLFSGETVSVSNGKKQFRHILQDAYRLTIVRSDAKWTGSWEELAPMPKGIDAGGSPLPVLKNGTMVFWGGVDALTALHKDPSLEQGVSKEILYYYPDTDLWDYPGNEEEIPARVTLPVVRWNNQWVYISGEIKSGIRTNTVYSIHDDN
jgi:N-acetylneuraminate epimerase